MASRLGKAEVRWLPFKGEKMAAPFKGEKVKGLIKVKR